jgi:predicted transcriptional regulator
LFGPKTKPIEVVSKPIEKTPLDIPPPDPLKLEAGKWIIITPENVEEHFAKIRESGTPVVVFALTPQGYESLSMSFAELRNFVATQREIIIKYREYYEPAKPAGEDTKK